MVTKQRFWPELSILWFSLIDFSLTKIDLLVTRHLKKPQPFQNVKAADAVQWYTQDLCISSIQLIQLRSSSLGDTSFSETLIPQEIVLHQNFLKATCFSAIFFVLLSYYFAGKILLFIYKVKFLKVMTIKTFKTYF